MIKVRTMNEYQIDAMLKSDIDINYDNFYKEQLIDMLKVCRDRYKMVQQRIDKVNRIIDECLMLMPHEFSWEEQIENIRKILGR